MTSTPHPTPQPTAIAPPSVVSSKLKPDQIPCALCSRMRRGAVI